MTFSKNAVDLINRRYAHASETPEKVFRRVAKALSVRDEKFEKDLYESMINGVLFPNSPCLRNAGKKSGVLHACFVLPLEDSMSGIFETVKNTANIFKAGGGCGINFSSLRPKGAALKAGGTSSGAVSFMGIFDAITETVKQGGMRRGALMGVLNPTHPEILDFCRAKLRGSLTNFNLSVMATDEFMKKATTKKNGGLELTHDGTVYGSVRAKDVLDMVALGSWISGDPSLLFFDRINRDNPKYPAITVSCVNPCQPAGSLLLDGDRLVPIEAGGKTWDSWSSGTKHVIELHCNNGLTLRFTPEHKIMLENGDWVCAKDTRNTALKVGLSAFNLLDNPISVTAIKEVMCAFPQFQIGEACKVVEIRDLGEMEVFDYRMNEGPHYNFCQGVIASNCSESPLPDYGACALASINLSKLVEGNNFNFERFYDLVRLAARALLHMNLISHYPLASIAKLMLDLNPIGVGVMGFADALIMLGIKYDSPDCLAFIDKLKEPYIKGTDEVAPDSFFNRVIAPTGSLSILGDCSASIEPVYSRSYERNLSYGTIFESKSIYQSEHCRTALEISPEWHLKVQAKFQSFLDGGVSKTVNLPYEASVDDVKNIYIQAWKLGCKGVTIFRDGSIDGVYKKVEARQKCEGETCSL